MVKTRKTPQKAIKMTKGSRKKWLIPVILIAVAAIAAAIILTVFFVTHGRVVMKIGGITVREDLYSCFLSYGRYQYRGKYGATDTDAFWMSDNGEGITHEEACRRMAEEYMISVISAAAAFESAGAGLSAEERRKLERDAEALLDNGWNGKKSEYNDLAEEFGFSFSAIRRFMLYMAEAQSFRLTCYDKSVLTNEDLHAYYQEAYRRVILIEVRTENRYVLGEEGEPILSPDGGYQMVALTEAEKTEARSRIESIRASLTNDPSYENLTALAASYNEDINRSEYTDGYYLSADSDFSVNVFATELPEVLRGVLEMSQGQWAEYDTGVSTVFAYVTGLTSQPWPWEKDVNLPFFSDLEKNVIEYYQNKLFRAYTEKKIEDKPIRRKVADGISLLDVGVGMSSADRIKTRSDVYLLFPAQYRVIFF